MHAARHGGGIGCACKCTRSAPSNTAQHSTAHHSTAQHSMTQSDTASTSGHLLTPLTSVTPSFEPFQTPKLVGGSRPFLSTHLCCTLPKGTCAKLLRHPSMHVVHAHCHSRRSRQATPLPPTTLHFFMTPGMPPWQPHTPHPHTTCYLHCHHVATCTLHPRTPCSTLLQQQAS